MYPVHPRYYPGSLCLRLFGKHLEAARSQSSAVEFITRPPPAPFTTPSNSAAYIYRS